MSALCATSFDGVQGITEGRLIWYNIHMDNEIFERNLSPFLVHDHETMKKGV